MPSFVQTTPIFSGWMTSDQVAQFEYSDTNLRDDYVDPNCVITSEGPIQTCSISPNICDKAGNCNTDVQTSNPVNIDKTPPTSTFNLPPIANNWNGVIAGVASDAVSGVAKVELLIVQPNGEEIIAEVNGTNDWSYTLPNVVNGLYIVTSKAIDAAGNNQNPVTERRIILDNLPPGIPQIDFVLGWFGKIELRWRGVEGADHYHIYYGTRRDRLNFAEETTATSWTSEVLKQGQYYEGVVAVDSAGNESEMSQIKKVEVHKKWDMRRWFVND